MRRSLLTNLLFLLGICLPSAAGAQVDMTGTWKVLVNPDLLADSPEMWEFTQSGTSLDVVSPLVTATGTIDPDTGEFDFVLGAGEPPNCTGQNNSLAGTAALDDLTFQGLLVLRANTPTQCGGLTLSIRGARCLNAPLDPEEECITPYQTIAGTRLLVRDVAGRPDRRKVVFLARDTGYAPAEPGTGGDPRLGATLILARGSAEVASISLPAAGWSTLASGQGYRFRNPQGNFGPCRSAIWRDGLLKVACRGTGIGYTLDEPTQGAVSVTFQPGIGVRACAEFGGVLRDTPATTGHAAIFKALNAAEPGGCTPAAVP